MDQARHRLLGFVLAAALLLGSAPLTQAQQRAPSCSDGRPAMERGDHYCCEKDGVLYCCKKSNAKECHIEPAPGSRYITAQGRGAESASKDVSGSSCSSSGGVSSSMSSEEQLSSRADTPPAKQGKTCTTLPVVRTALSLMQQPSSRVDALNPAGALRLVTLTLTQTEGCEPPSEMTVRLAGVDPGILYRVNIGETTDCGGLTESRREIARLLVDGPSGAGNVPSRVPSLKDLQDKPVSLTSKSPDGEIITHACGVCTTL